MSKRIGVCFAYFIDGVFHGWYTDSFGTLGKKSPKIYTYSPEQVQVIQKNFNHKIKTIESSTYAEAKEKCSSLGDAFQLPLYQYEEFLRGAKVELRVVECPIYDGPNPDYDEVAFKESIAKGEKYDKPWWIYADYTLVNEWAKTAPIAFLEVLKPTYANAI